jgi:hypothetical protein
MDLTHSPVVRSHAVPFQKRALQISVQESTLIEAKSVNALGYNVNMIEFVIAGMSDHYMDLSDISLLVKLRFWKSQGTPLDDAVKEKLFFCENFLPSLIKSCEFWINQTNMTPSCEHYAYKACILSRLNHTASYGRTVLETGLYQPDPRKEGATLNNAAATVRKGYLTVDKPVLLQTNLLIDAATCQKLILNGCSLRCRITLNSLDFVCNVTEAAAPLPVLEIQDARLQVRSVLLTDQAALSNNQQLLKSPALYHYRKIEVRTQILPKDVTSFVTSALSLGVQPALCIAAFVDNQAFNGLKTADPFAFVHRDLENLSLIQNGKCMSYSDLDASHFYGLTSVYSNLLRNLGWHKQSTGCQVTPEAFVNGSFFASWLLTDDHEPIGTHTSVPKTGSLRIEGCFKSALQASLTLVVLFEYDSCFSIDSDRSVAINY